MKILVYTFRTFPNKETIESIFENLFVFGKLKLDFELLSEKILKEAPDMIIGIAKADKSKIETSAVNQFNKDKKIEKNGRDKYSLYVPRKCLIESAESSGTSFCNWTAYKIAKLIEENHLKTNLMFLHISKKDIPLLEELII